MKKYLCTLMIMAFYAALIGGIASHGTYWVYAAALLSIPAFFATVYLIGISENG